MLTSGYGGSDSVTLILVGALGQILDTQSRQRRPAPARPRYCASGSAPARPRGGEENLRDANPEGPERLIQRQALVDLPVVTADCARCAIRSPADAAHLSVEQSLSGASDLAIWSPASRTVDRDQRPPPRVDQLKNLILGLATTKRQESSVIHDRRIEALALTTHTDTKPASHDDDHHLLNDAAPVSANPGTGRAHTQRWALRTTGSTSAQAWNGPTRTSPKRARAAPA